MRCSELLAVVLLACQPGADVGQAADADLDRSVEATVDRSARPDASGSAEPARRQPVEAAVGQSVDPTLDHYDFDERERRFDLPGRLDEISGLALSPDGRLFAHDDERGRIHEIDPITGDVGKSFDLGDELARGDFEGIVIVAERFFLIASSGLLYEFREGDDEEEVRYRRTDTGVGFDCEVEGLDHDPELDALLLACKTSAPDRDRIVVHRVPMDPDADPLPPIRVERSDLSGVGVDEDFQPSAVAVTPEGTILLVSAPVESLVEIDREGRVLAGVKLSDGRHPQPEGLEVAPDGTLYVADEENEDDARLTVYVRNGGGGR